jgi:hypothetical protein
MKDVITALRNMLNQSFPSESHIGLRFQGTVFHLYKLGFLLFLGPKFETCRVTSTEFVHWILIMKIKPRMISQSV